jgi:hypothetical protein
VRAEARQPERPVRQVPHLRDFVVFQTRVAKPPRQSVVH